MLLKELRHYTIDKFPIILRKRKKSESRFCCPNEEAAMGIIVASPSCTAYQLGSLIAL